MQVLPGVIVGKLLVMCHFPVYPVHQVDPFLVIHGHAGGIDDILQFGNAAAALLHDGIIAGRDRTQLLLAEILVGQHLAVILHIDFRDVAEHQDGLFYFLAAADEVVHLAQLLVILPSLLEYLGGLLSCGEGILRRFRGFHDFVHAIHDALYKIAGVGHHPLCLHARCKSCQDKQHA